MDDRVDLTVPMESALNARIEEELGYNDSKAAWVREAIRQRLAIEQGDVAKVSDEGR